MQQEITKEDWVQWLSNPVTRNFFEVISERREEAIQQLAFGGIQGMSKKDITIGAINAYTHIMAIRFEEEIDGSESGS